MLHHSHILAGRALPREEAVMPDQKIQITILSLSHLRRFVIQFYSLVTIDKYITPFLVEVHSTKIGKGLKANSFWRTGRHPCGKTETILFLRGKKSPNHHFLYFPIHWPYSWIKLLIEGLPWMLGLLFSIVRNLISVSKVTSLWDHSFRLFSQFLCFCDCLCLGICLCLYHCLFVGWVMSPHHPNQMSQRTQVSGVAIWGWYLDIFVFAFDFVFVIVIVIIFVRGHCLFVGHIMHPHHSDEMCQRSPPQA